MEGQGAIRPLINVNSMESLSLSLWVKFLLLANDKIRL